MCSNLYNNINMMQGNQNSNPAGAASDALLCEAARQGDHDAMEQLVQRHAGLVELCARPYFLAGADKQDLTQEGMIGLLKAIRTYNPAAATPFTAYARLCITRWIYSAIRAAASQKHEILNTSISLEKPLFDDNAEPRPQVAEPISDPESLVIGMEEYKERLRRLLGSLSVFEAKVLRLYLDGCSYEEMSARLHRPIKSVDNAIQRIRRKSAAI